MAALSPARRLLAVDLRGHGESGWAPGTYSLNHYVADVVRFCEQVVGQPAVLVGHSLGAAIAMTVAQRRPDLVKALLLEDPPLAPSEQLTDHPLRQIFAAERDVIAQMRDRDAPAEEYADILVMAPAMNRAGSSLADVLGDAGTRAQAWALAHVDPLTLDAVLDGSALDGVRPDAPIACPVLLLRADPDLLTAFRDEDEEALRAANPHIEVTTVGGASHLIHDEKPDRFLDELRRFLQHHGD